MTYLQCRLQRAVESEIKYMSLGKGRSGEFVTEHNGGGITMIHKDCFAYKNAGRHPHCIALKELYCKKEECNWYKSKAKEQHQRERRDGE